MRESLALIEDYIQRLEAMPAPPSCGQYKIYSVNGWRSYIESFKLFNSKEGMIDSLFAMPEVKRIMDEYEANIKKSEDEYYRIIRQYNIPDQEW